MAILAADYSEKILAEVCGPKGLCTKQNFFPTIAELKKALEEAKVRDFEQNELPKIAAKKIQDQLADRISGAANTKPCYTGPIENVKPGDILSWDRQKEYEEFMFKKHNMRNIKRWGANEKFRDSGHRPFDEKKENTNPEEPNPFL